MNMNDHLTIHTTGTPSPTPKMGFRLQQRDVLIVEAVHRHRVLSTDQIAALYFPTATSGVSSSCLNRLRHLVRTGFLARGEQLQAKTEGRRPYVYMMTSAGCELLQDQFGYEEEDIDWKPSYNDVQWMFLAHQLAINEVYVTLAKAVEPIGWHLDRWVDDRILKQQAPQIPIHENRELVAVVPDAYFSLVGPGGSPTLQFFLECDRGTVTVAGAGRTATWTRRIKAYQAYFASEEIHEQYGTNRIRVLSVTTGERRLVSLKRATEAAGGRKRYWFAVADRVSPARILLKPEWQVAGQDGRFSLIAKP